VLTGERYKTITKETAGILSGQYGKAPGELNSELQARVLNGEEAITCRPADLLEAEMARLEAEVEQLAKDKGFALAEAKIDDALTYALFPQIGLKFLENRGNPDAFEPVPSADDVKAVAAKTVKAGGVETYSVRVDGQLYTVDVGPEGSIDGVAAVSSSAAAASAPAASAASGSAEELPAPLAGNIFKVVVQPGAKVQEGDVLLIMEAMKMETEIRSAKTGVVEQVLVKEGDAVAVGEVLLSIA
jgi:oxaloacetate decarboxylase alpha subunit